MSRLLIPAKKEQNVFYIRQYDQKCFLDVRHDDEYATPWSSGGVGHEPLVSTFLDSTSSVAERATRSRFDFTRGRPSGLRESHDTNEEQVIGVGEEVLNIGTRMVAGKTTRVRRVVVQTPVQQDVTLHTELACSHI
jgi:hypothetical protein